MKFLFILGGSGSGKTTLAKNLEIFDPKKFYRSVELSTRKPREGEINGVDYYFITENELEEFEKDNKLLEKVIYQFSNKYGCSLSEIKEDKINIIIVSIEGFMNAANNLKKLYNDVECALINIIIDCDLDIEREGRDAKKEEMINRAVIMNIPNNFKEENGLFSGNFKNQYWPDIYYQEIKLSELKEFRNCKDRCLEYFNGFFRI